MSSLLGISGAIGTQINSKASAVAYVISLCTSYNEKSKTCSVDTKKAQKILNFVFQNVQLQDAYAEMAEDFKPYIEKILKGLETKLQTV